MQSAEKHEGRAIYILFGVVVQLVAAGCVLAVENRHLAPIKVDSGWGYVDISSHKLLPAPVFEFAGPFFNGRAVVRLDGKYGLIDSDGLMVMEPKYDAIRSPSDGMVVFEMDGRFGMANTQGEVVCKPQFDSLRDFSDGASIATQDEDVYIIFSNGKVIKLVGLVPLTGFSEGRAVVIGDNGKKGYINTHGELVVPMKHDLAEPFKEGVAAVANNGKWSFISSAGEMLFEGKFDSLGELSGGFAIAKQDGKWGVTNAQGKWEFPPIFSQVNRFVNRVAAARVGSYWFILNARERPAAFPTSCSSIERFCEGLAPAEENAKWGFVSESGEWAVLPSFTKVELIGNGFGLVWENDNCFLFSPAKGRLPIEKPKHKGSAAH